MFFAFIGLRTKHRGTGFLFAIFITFLLLSCGPVISIFDQPASPYDAQGNPVSLFGPTWIPGPFLLVQHLPVFGSMRVPGRFITTSEIALGFLAAFGLLRVLRWGFLGDRKWKKILFIFCVLVFHQIDINNWPVKFAPNQYSPYFETVAEQPGDFSILDVPYNRGMHQYMHYGAYHHKHVIWGFGSRVPQSDLESVESDFVFPGIVTVDPAEWNPDVPKFVNSLKKYRVKYIFFHELHLDLMANIRKKLIAYFEDPDTWRNQSVIAPPEFVYEDRVLRVYRITYLDETDNGG